MEPETFWVKPLEPVQARTIKLPPSDQIGVRVIIPRALCFLTDAEFDTDNLIQGLRSAVAATIYEAPFLAGKIVYSDQSASRVQVEIPEDPSVEVRVVRHPEISGPDLDAKYWPPHAMPYMKFCLPNRPMGAVDNFCFGMQVNILSGGVVILLQLNHAIVDGYSLSLIQQTLAEHMGRFLNGEPAKLTGKIPAEAQDRSVVFGTHPARGLTEWRDWKTVSTSDPQPTRKPLALTVWHIPADKVEVIRKSGQPPQSRLSTATCLSSFLWRAVTASRKLSPDTVTTMLTPIQARQRVNPQLHVAYCGNVLVYGRAHMTVSELLSRPLHEVGTKMDNGVKWWTGERIREYWGSVEDVPNLAVVAPNTNRDFGTDFEVSNIANMPFWNMDWGKGLRVRAFRWPGFAVTDGWVNVLPRLPDGSFDIIIHTMRDALEHLLQDKEFRECVLYRCSSDQALDEQILAGK